MAALLESIFCEILKNPRANRHYRTHPTNSSAPAEKITQILAILAEFQRSCARLQGRIERERVKKDSQEPAARLLRSAQGEATRVPSARRPNAEDD